MNPNDICLFGSPDPTPGDVRLRLQPCSPSTASGGLVPWHFFVRVALSPQP